jgi:hypothetical protein
MTDQQRPSGYRGALPERHDAMARPWVVTVIAIFVLMFVLPFVGFPSSLFPGASGSPLASNSLAPSASSAASASPSGSGSQ